MKASIGTSSGKAGADRGIETFRYHTKIRGLYLAMMWNVTAWPLGGMAFVESQGAWWHGLTLAPAGIGCWLGALAVRRYVRYRRDGPATLFVDPPVPRPGSPFAIRFVLQRATADGRRFQARFKCVRHETCGDDGHSSKVLWSEIQRIEVRGNVAAGTFAPPPTVPSAQETSVIASGWFKGTDVHHAWVIELDRGGYLQEFTLPAGPLQIPAGRASTGVAVRRRRDRTRKPGLA